MCRTTQIGARIPPSCREGENLADLFSVIGLMSEKVSEMTTDLRGPQVEASLCRKARARGASSGSAFRLPVNLVPSRKLWECQEHELDIVELDITRAFIGGCHTNGFGSMATSRSPNSPCKMFSWARATSVQYSVFAHRRKETLISLWKIKYSMAMQLYETSRPHHNPECTPSNAMRLRSYLFRFPITSSKANILQSVCP